MNAKLLLIILGVLIVLFFVSAGWGLSSDDQSVGGAAEAVVSLVRGLEDQAKKPLSLDEVSNATPANCRTQLQQRQFTLAQGDSCQLDVGKSSTPVRTLTLHLQQGDQVELRMNGFDEPATLPHDEGDDRRRLELQFVREGDRLVIDCISGSSPQNRCVINVPSS